MEIQAGGCSYHIFLSFRGADTRKGFTDHLYTAFCNAGFHTFRDDDEIPKGKHIQPELEKAIKESSVSVIVFSKHYAYSKWCLNELVNILNRKKYDHRYAVFPIFYDVEPRDVGTFKEAFAADSASKHMITEWKNALKEVSKLTGRVLQDQSNGHEAVFIQTIVKDIGIILKRTVLAVAPYTVGVESRVKDIDLWLRDPADTRVGVINGMRGIGKTTIAKVAYNLNFSDFEASCFLANIREASENQHGVARLQNQLLSDISKGKTQKIYNPDEGIIKIQAAISRKRILVILDDVDHDEQIDALIGAANMFVEGSKIIITTSRERLLRHQKHKTFFIKQLDNNDSLQLFSLHAFSQDTPIQEYLEHSERVVRHCEGHPLALHLMGSFLIGRNLEFWESALEKQEALPDVRICKRLEVSYKSLHDDHDKRLFLRIALSFIGQDMDAVVEELVKESYYSKIGMLNLKDRYLISVDRDNKLVMHPLVHDMATLIMDQDSPGKHDLCNSSGTITETVTSEESLLYKNDVCGKRKRFEDEPMAPNGEGSSVFKRLCLGFSFLFEQATRVTKRLTIPHGLKHL